MGCTEVQRGHNEEVYAINEAFLMAENNKHQEAINQLRAIRPLVKDYSYIFNFNLANSLHQIGAYDSAIYYYKTAYLINPLDTNILKNYVRTVQKRDSINQNNVSNEKKGMQDGDGQQQKTDQQDDIDSEDAKLIEKLDDMNVAKRSKNNKKSKRKEKDHFW